MESLEYRKVQGLVGEQSFSIVLPKMYAIHLGIGKGDFVKIHEEDKKLLSRRHNRTVRNSGQLSKKELGHCIQASLPGPWCSGRSTSSCDAIDNVQIIE